MLSMGLFIRNREDPPACLFMDTYVDLQVKAGFCSETLVNSYSPNLAKDEMIWRCYNSVTDSSINFWFISNKIARRVVRANCLGMYIHDYENKSRLLSLVRWSHISLFKQNLGIHYLHNIWSF